MSKTLQKKFVVTAMIAVTVLLAVVLGAVNLFNALTQARQSDRLLTALAMQEGFGPAPRFDGDFDGQEPPFRREERGGFFREPLTEDSRMSALYFVVRLDSENQVQSVDLRRISSVDEEGAAALALQAAADNRGYGRIGDLKYQFVEPAEGCRVCGSLFFAQRAQFLQFSVLPCLVFCDVI